MIYKIFWEKLKWKYQPVVRSRVQTYSIKLLHTIANKDYNGAITHMKLQLDFHSFIVQISTILWRNWILWSGKKLVWVKSFFERYQFFQNKKSVHTYLTRLNIVCDAPLLIGDKKRVDIWTMSLGLTGKYKSISQNSRIFFYFKCELKEIFDTLWEGSLLQSHECYMSKYLLPMYQSHLWQLANAYDGEWTNTICDLP